MPGETEIDCYWVPTLISRTKVFYGKQENTIIVLRGKEVFQIFKWLFFNWNFSGKIICWSQTGYWNSKFSGIVKVLLYLHWPYFYYVVLAHSFAVYHGSSQSSFGILMNMAMLLYYVADATAKIWTCCCQYRKISTAVNICCMNRHA